MPCLPHPSPPRRHYIKELKQRRFWATPVNRKLPFFIFGRWFCPNFQSNRLYKSKETKQYKLHSVKAYYKGKVLTSGWLLIGALGRAANGCRERLELNFPGVLAVKQHSIFLFFIANHLGACRYRSIQVISFRLFAIGVSCVKVIEINHRWV